MRKKFTANLLLLLLLNVLVKPVWIFGIDRSVQNIVGATDYGLYYALFNLSLILNIILDLGLTNFNNREISRHPNLLAKYLSNIVGVKLLLSLVYAVVTIGLAYILGYGHSQLPLLMLLIFNQFLSSFILYMRSNLNALQFFAVDSILSVLDKLLMILICGLVIWGRLGGDTITINTFVLTQTVSYLIVVAVAVATVMYKGGRFSVHLNRASTIAILKQSYPYAILVLLMATYGRMDILMVERLLPNGSYYAGVYAQAFRLVDAYNMFPFLVASLLMPIFSRMYKEGTNLEQFVKFSIKIMLIPVLAVALPTIFFREPVMDLLYSCHTEQSSQLLGILMGSFIFISVNYIFGTLLTAVGRVNTQNIISLVAVIVGFVLQVVLVGKLGVRGAAIGNLSVSMLVAVCQMIVAIKVCKLKIGGVLIVRYATFALLSVVACWLIARCALNVYTFLASPIAVVAIAFMLRLIDVRELLNFLVNNNFSRHKN